MPRGYGSGTIRDSTSLTQAEWKRILKLFSKIRSNKDFKPGKKTAISLCFGLELGLEDSLDLLGKAGYTLSHSSKFDLIIEYFIKTGEYDIDLLNQILYDYGLDTLYI